MVLGIMPCRVCVWSKSGLAIQRGRCVAKCCITSSTLSSYCSVEANQFYWKVLHRRIHSGFYDGKTDIKKNKITWTFYYGKLPSHPEINTFSYDPELNWHSVTLKSTCIHKYVSQCVWNIFLRLSRPSGSQLSVPSCGAPVVTFPWGSVIKCNLGVTCCMAQRAWSHCRYKDSGSRHWVQVIPWRLIRLTRICL